MISAHDLEQTARSYLQAARVLNRQGTSYPDASLYLCGYVIEIALKARICRNLGWTGYPETSAEFHNYRTFQTHNLDVLLHLAGGVLENRIKSDPQLWAQWSIAQTWNPEQRYNPVGTRTPADAQGMITEAAKLLKVLI